MHIIIIGAGEVGFQIAERLVSEKHDVVIVDRDPEKIMELNRTLDVLTVIGQGGDFTALDKAGIRNCDILIAATDADETNMIACFIAKKFNVPSKIARIRGYLFDSNGLMTQEEFGIDVLINPEQAATEDIIKLINSPAAFEIVDYEEERLLIKGFKITANLVISENQIKDLAKFTELNKMNILAIIRQDKIIIPGGEDTLHVGDKVYIIGRNEDFSEIMPYFNESYESIKNVFLIGASKISQILCNFFQKEGIHVKVIEPDRNQCLLFAEEYHKIDVINCSPTDLESLKDEGLLDIDAFIALSDDEEMNILSSMLAKRQNVRKTIAKIQKNDYLPFASTMGIDAVINPKLSTVGQILKYVRTGNILSVDTLGEMNAEAIEYLVTERCKCLNKPLKEIKLPSGCLISAIIRGENRIIPRGNDSFQLNDKVIVFSLSETVEKIGRLFG